jgi:hypothetical protein
MITPQMITKKFSKQHSIKMYYDKRKQHPISYLDWNKKYARQVEINIFQKYWQYNK